MARFRRIPAPLATFLAATAVAGLIAVAPGAGTAAPASIFVGDGEGGTAQASRDAMLQIARKRGELPVIVQMRTDFVPEGDLSLFQAANQRTAIASLQQRIIDRVGAAKIKRQFEAVPMMAMTVDPAQLGALLDDPDVEAVFEDVAVPPSLDQSVPHIGAKKASKLKAINGGKGWAVAVLDTGVQRGHKSLKGKIVSEACYSSTISSQQSTSVCPGGAQSSTATKSGKNCDLSIEGCDHGTHVSGIAVGNPKGYPYKGVARKASLIPIQVFSRFTGTANCGSSSPCALSWSSDQLAALERVNALASTHKIAAVNMSLGGGLYKKACNSNSLKPIIDTLRSKGIAVAIAAGNDGLNKRVSSPGCISSAITVASTTLKDKVSWFSNFSKLVDVAAPGSDITSSVPGGGFASWNGTSMATPHVAGTWALLKHAFPSASVGDVLKALKCTGKKVSRAGINKPRISVYRAYQAMKNGCP